jgi:hypothetical protein
MKQGSFKKSFYVLLTALLGILMFVILQRSAALIGFLLLNMDYGRFNPGATPTTLHFLNIITYVIAVILGGWYGIWLGLYWYRVVYEQGTGGAWHGFVGNFFHDHTNTPALTPTKTISVQAPAKKVAVAPQTPKTESESSWGFDDLLMRKRTATSDVRSRPKVATRQVIESLGETAAPVKKRAVVRKTATKKASTETAPAKKRVTSTRKPRTSKSTPVTEI